MKMKYFMIFPLSLFIWGKSYGYVYGPEVNGVNLYNEQNSSFIDLQGVAKMLRFGLMAKSQLGKVPLRPVTDEDVLYQLYTRKNPNISIILRSNDSLEKLRSSLNVEIPTTFYVHGYNETVAEGAYYFTKYLLPKRDINIIVVNWDSYAAFDPAFTTLITTPKMGKILGKFIQKLVNAGVDPKMVHLFGFSAGGEMVGLAGKTINPRVGRISAFEPQGDIFNFLPPSERISKGDADFVQIVHCTSGLWGLPRTFQGDVTFIMNEGVVQPQCHDLTTVNYLDICSHLQCRTYLYESLKENSSMVGIKCDKFEDYASDKCDCRDRLALAYEVPMSARGFYFVDTVSD